MKNLLSKTLLCGVIATSFLLINCQKAPNRPAKGTDAGAAAKPGAAAIVGDCAKSPEIATLSAEIKALDAEIVALDAKAVAGADGKKVLPAADHADAQAKARSLAQKTDLLIAAIRTSGPAGQAAESCVRKEKDEATQADKIVETIKIADLQQRRIALVTLTENMTGTTLPDARPAPKLEASDRVKMSSDMAAQMKDAANLSKMENNAVVLGNLVIIEGIIQSKGEYNDALAAKDKTICLITTIDASRAMNENTILQILPLTEGSLRVTGRSVVGVAMQAAAAAPANEEVDATEPQGIISLDCVLAEQKDAGEELHKALKDLVIKQAAVAQPVTVPAGGDDTAADTGGDADTATGGGTTAGPAAGNASGDPSLPVSGDPSLPISGDPSLPISGDPSLPISGDPTLPISGDPTQPISGDDTVAGDVDAAIGALDQALSRSRAQ